jgi:phosphate starvation-inducible protein PhoH
VEAGENLGFLPGDMKEKIRSLHAAIIRRVADMLNEKIRRLYFKRYYPNSPLALCAVERLIMPL